MAAFYYLVLAVACVSVRAFPQDPLPFDRNTIFGDEKLEGEVFEHIDDFNGLTLYTRNDNPYRLPITTRPLHYDILWTIEIPRLVFSGEVNMQVYATSANVNEIVFHSKDLNIRSLSVSKNATAVPIQDYVLQPEYQFLRVRLLRSVLEYNPSSPVIYTVSIVFDAPLRTDMNGIYRSWYRNNSTDEVRWMATTQFQSTAARSALPCYDEPGFKATFAITIRRPSLFRSWSCTRIRETRPSNITGYDEDEFHPTPVMSTYLLAIIVAEYESLAQTNNGTLLYEVIARPSAINTNQGDYAFDVGQRLLARMSNHTDYDFYAQHPHLKMTQAAIPDFSAGAMENWGLLTYREAYLMYDENHTNSYFKQLIAYILSHEIAHMWFGNVVTCDWWDVLWLNEGFARYYQYFLTDWVEEHLGLRTRFINEQMHTALLTDSANNPHPLSNTGVGSPGAVSAMFSTLTYNKGAAIIRMTEHLLGFDVHREGLRKYLADRKFETAQPIHLFQALQDAALASGAISEYGPGFSVIDYYRSWTEQGGHPVLNVQVDHKTGLMTINQRRFNINSGYSAPTTNWIIPITFATASNNDFNNTKPTHIITGAISIINRTTVGDEWVIFNKQQTGFYRVNYDDYTWDLITIALRGPQRTVINEFNKAQIVNDVFQFARSGLMSYNKALSIISFLEFETEYTPWVAAITGFNWVRNRLIGTPLQARFEDRFRSWATNVMSSLTYYPEENESFMRSYQRYQLAPFLCQLNASECRAAARAQFDELRLNNTEVPVDSRHWVYCNALRDGRPEDFDFLWARYLAHNVYTEKILLLQNLGCTSHEQSLYRFLDAIVQDNFVIRPQDYTSAFSSAVNGNEGNTQIVFKYIKENLVNMTQAFGSPSTPLSYISSRLRSQQQIEEFEQWADDNREQLGTVFQSVRNGAQTSRNALQWAASVQADIDSFLNGEVNVQTTTSTPVTTLSTTTVSPPALVEPVTPEPVPGSANAAILSALVIVIAFVLNLAL